MTEQEQIEADRIIQQGDAALRTFERTKGRTQFIAALDQLDTFKRRHKHLFRHEKNGK
jgi:hypothetical protein